MATLTHRKIYSNVCTGTLACILCLQKDCVHLLIGDGKKRVHKSVGKLLHLFTCDFLILSHFTTTTVPVTFNICTFNNAICTS